MAPHEPTAKGWYLAIEGATGCGKTTLARRLAGPLGARLFCDPFDRNPFLITRPSAPHEPCPETALASELTFLALRIGELRRIGALLENGGHVIADWALVKTRIFPRLTLAPYDADRVEAACSLWEPGLCIPDLLIYLHASPPLLAERIKNRGRAFEQGISTTDLASLTGLFSAVLSELPVMGIDTGAFDAFDDTAVADLSAKILARISQ